MKNALFSLIAFGTIVAATSVLAEPVNPKLAGTSFMGTLISEGGVPGTSCIAFGADGTVAYDERAFGVPATEAFQGDYEEFPFGILSLWRATLLDGSADGEFVGAGLSVANKLMIAGFQNPDFSPSWSALYVQQVCVPGDGVSAEAIGLGIAGGR